MRKSNRVLAMGLASAMVMGSLAGCSSGSSSASNTTTKAAESTTAKGSETATTTATDSTEKTSGSSDESSQAEETTVEVSKADSEIKYRPENTVTLNVFSQVANYAGEQKGWIADIMLEKFNVKLNIINDSDGSQITQRLQTGDIGDIIVMGSRDDNYNTAVEKGYLLNWNKDNLLSEYGAYIKEQLSDALEYNAAMNNGVVYGFTGSVAKEGSANDGGTIYTWDVRWDLYDQLGQPAVTDLDSLLDLMKKMKEICPKDANGKDTYALSMWPDWDGNMVMYVKAFATAYFGYDEWGLGLYDVNTGTVHGALEENGPYWQALKFINELYRNGLVDPNSKTQTYQKMSEKMSAGGIFFSIFNYAGSGLYNSEEHIAANSMMLPLIPSEATPIVNGVSTTGSGYEWAIGANTQYPELCMEIMNWLCTPEGALTYWYGPEGEDKCWYYDADGYLHLTDFGKKAQNDRYNTDMSEIGYSGTYDDGSFQVNSNVWLTSSINPESKYSEPFLKDLWNSMQDDPKCEIEAKWRSYSGQTVYTAYLLNWENKVYAPYTGVSFKNPSKKSDLYTSWNAVAEQIVTGTWACIYAETDEEFNKLFAEMTEKAKSYGYDDCITYTEEQAVTRHAMEEILLED